jgi:hypothetical protein
MSEITLDSLIEEHKELGELYEIDNFVVPYQYNDMQKYRDWLAKTERFLFNKYPNDKDCLEFQKISKKTLTKTQQEKLIAILKAFKEIPTIVSINQNTNINEVENTNNNSINVNINNNNSQTQNQEQSIAIEFFLEAIKDELTGKQIKEINSIIKESDNDVKKARPKIIEKIKEFGIDTVSNIITNILTNPTIWNYLLNK